MYTEIAKSYLRKEKFPSVWCPGCGHGLILASILRAIHKKGWKKEETVMVSGIGCAGRIPGYVDFCTLHTTHGRALAFATGIKFARPELNVIAVMGDGDAAAIGGNHLIHAARRNINITAIVFNNFIYGMTGGQKSPTTPRGFFSSTSPYGNAEPPFDLCNMVKGAGAVFVARGTEYHLPALDTIIYKALSKNGFSFVDVIVMCPTSFGRKNKLSSDATQNMEWIKSISIPKKKAEGLSQEELQGKIVIGIFADSLRSEFVEYYEREILKEGKCPKNTKSD
ncbi:MAG: 2-oxoacid:ferredoxin oxidoreductase subunit beta [Candidatus Cloacimonadota bacterium]|nr:MAG: 2-oxoacid:ferredoxin oxidoreductase subunit beta [Candidatus Cloacimonadota bacterium]